MLRVESVQFFPPFVFCLESHALHLDGRLRHQSSRDVIDLVLVCLIQSALDRTQYLLVTLAQLWKTTEETDSG